MNVLDIISKQYVPVDAGFIIKNLKVNKTTVYRQIEKLLKNKLIIGIEFGDGKKRYELKSLNHHHHLICRKCKKLEDISLNEEIFLEEINKISRFKVESHSLEFFGLCVNCIK